MLNSLSAGSLYDLSFISDLDVAPDGGSVAYVASKIVDGTPPRYISRVHVASSLSAATAVPSFTQGPGKDTHPRFSPDGSQLAFLSDRSGGNAQVFIASLAGGEAYSITDLPAGVTEFAWLPSGEGIVLIARTGSNEDLGGLARRITGPYYKADGVGFRSTFPSQVWSVDLEGGPPVQQTDLHTSASQVSVAADGVVYFVAARNADAEARYFRQVWRLQLGADAPEPVVDQPDPLIAAWPVSSPDGTQIAYLAPSDPTAISSPTGLWTVASQGGVPHLRSPDGIDAVPLVGGDSRLGNGRHAPIWTGNDTLLVYSGALGSGMVAHLTLSDDKLEPLHSEGTVVTAFAAAGTTLATIRERSDRPGEAYAQPLPGRDGEEVRLTNLNDAFVARYSPVPASPLQEILSDDGQATLGYWILTPASPRPDNALVLQIHGGPRTTYGHGFSFEMQLMTSLGYTVVFGNPRGSAGFGREFSDAISGRLGTIDADDVLAIARDARTRHGKLGAPMHVTGGSYGGFMTNWLVGVTDEFVSAVTQRSISNWPSMWGTSDVGFSWMNIEVGDVPWRDPQRLWTQSPMANVEKVNTPILVIHAEEDHRTPIEQAEQWFVAINTLGNAPTEFLRFPDEGHDLSRSGRPDRRVQRLEAILEWFARHPVRD